MPFYPIWGGDALPEDNEYVQRVESAIEETRWAKIVETANGFGILLDGSVIELSSADPYFHTEVITRALRRAGQESSSTVQGCDSYGNTTFHHPV